MTGGPLVARLRRSLSGALLRLPFLPQAVMFLLCLLLLYRGIPLQLGGDAILTSLISLQKLTLYFWWQDRFGNLLPLLAAWIRNPIDNATAQLWLRFLAGLVAPTFFCSFFFRRPADIWRAAILGDALLLAFARAKPLYEIFVQASPYGPSLACAGLASMLLRAPGPRLGGTLATLAGVLLVVAAYIVNVGLVILALPIVGLFALLLPSAHAARLLVVHLVAAAIGLILPRLVAPEFPTPLDLIPPIQGISRFAATAAWKVTGWPYLAVALGIAALTVPPLWRLGRAGTIRPLSTAGAILLGVAVLNFAIVGSSRWVSMNAAQPRYFMPVYLLLLSLGGLSLWAAVRFAGRGRLPAPLAFVVLAGALLLVAGLRLPAPAGGVLIEERWSGLARAVAARYVGQSLDGIVGDYWAVWPAVLMTESDHYAAGYGGANVLGITYRGGVRRDDFVARLATRGELRLACIDLEPQACAEHAAAEMSVPPLPYRELAPAEPMPDGHRLGYIVVTAGEP
jgi:hypothetical protein